MLNLYYIFYNVDENPILTNRSYKQWTIEGNQYSHTFILHNKFGSICFNCVHLFYNKFVEYFYKPDANAVVNLQRCEIPR